MAMAARARTGESRRSRPVRTTAGIASAVSQRRMRPLEGAGVATCGRAAGRFGTLRGGCHGLKEDYSIEPGSSLGIGWLAMRRLLLVLWMTLGVAAAMAQTPAAGNTFTNPLLETGPDPWVVLVEGLLLLLQHDGHGAGAAQDGGYHRPASCAQEGRLDARARAGVVEGAVGSGAASLGQQVGISTSRPMRGRTVRTASMWSRTRATTQPKGRGC